MFEAVPWMSGFVTAILARSGRADLVSPVKLVVGHYVV